MINDGRLEKFVTDRYAGWDSDEAKAILDGKTSVDELASSVHDRGMEPSPRSGKQEFLEQLVNKYL